MIIPSIDLMEGKAVQLRQGKEKVLERENVLELAKEFRKYGEIAVIDLDAAFGKGDNSDLIKQICRISDCRVGGGIRTTEKAKEILKAGANKVIIGTKASPEFLKELPREKVIVAIDSKDGKVVTKGWTEKTSKTPLQVIGELEPYCSEFLYTNVNREGMLGGINKDEIKKLREATKNKFTVAGGITAIEEIKLLESLDANSQLGMSIYTGKISLAEAFTEVLDFGKMGGLIPAVVQEENGQVLMVGFSNRDSVLKTFATGRGSYYSRSKKSLWTKGETSGNYQNLVKARFDCDRDALLYTVKQTNVACHTGKYSCFGEKEFSIDEIYKMITERVENPTKGSYTSKISQKEESIKKKIREESEEIINYKDRENLIWETADLIYFIMVLLAKNKVSLNEVRNELWGRKK